MVAQPVIGVECRTLGCRAFGARRRIGLRPVALGFVERPNLVCISCGAMPEIVSGWPLGLAPESTQGEQEEGAEMAKITVHGGPSNAAADPPDAAAASNSTTSTSTPSPAPEPSSAGAHSPADDTPPDDTTPPADAAPAWDPAGYTVPVVLEHLAAAAGRGDQAEVDRVLAAERAGKQRTGVLTFTTG